MLFHHDDHHRYLELDYLRGAKPAAAESAAHIHHVVTEHLAPAFSAASRYNLIHYVVTFQLLASFEIHPLSSIVIHHVILFFLAASKNSCHPIYLPCSIINHHPLNSKCHKHYCLILHQKDTHGCNCGLDGQSSRGSFTLPKHCLISHF